MMASGVATGDSAMTAPADGIGASPKIGLRSAVWLKSGLDPFPVVLDLAARAERAGIDAVFFGDRMLAEASEGGEGVYASTHTEIFTTLAAIAARTTTIRIGTLVLVVPFRHPVALAKTIASLDLLSEGRLLLGVGTGWSPDEFAALGVNKADAAAILEEDVALMKQLWSGERVDFSGRFRQLHAVAVQPTPRRPGGPPIWLGSFSPVQTSIWHDEITSATQRGLERVGRMADTWIPLLYSTRYRRSIDPSVLAEAFRRVQASAATSGRPPRSISFAFSHWYYVIDGPQDEAAARRDLAAFFPGTLDEARDTYLVGTAEEIVRKVRQLCSQIEAPEWLVFTQLGNSPRQLELLVDQVLPQLRIAA